MDKRDDGFRNIIIMRAGRVVSPSKVSSGITPVGYSSEGYNMKHLLYRDRSDGAMRHFPAQDGFGFGCQRYGIAVCRIPSFILKTMDHFRGSI